MGKRKSNRREKKEIIDREERLDRVQRERE